MGLRHGGFIAAMVVLMGLGAWAIAQEKQAKEKQAQDKQAKDKEAKEERDPSIWMKQKLTYSERILEGLAKGDMDLINKNASAMRALNRIEYFVRRDPPAYRTQLNVFQFSVDELIRCSQEDNLDGAALAFTQMTMSCVNCHKHIRKT
jgi:hypothetical protein